MHDWRDVWEKGKAVSGVSVAVCACLYVIRCVMTFRILSMDQFDHWMRGLLRYIFA